MKKKLTKEEQDEKEMEEFSQRFDDALHEFLQPWLDDPKYDSYVIARSLIHKSKVHSCCAIGDYFIMSGLLIDLLLDGLKEMHAHIRNFNKKVKK